MVGEVARARKYTLLNDPGIRPHFQHFEIVIRLQNQAIAFAQMHFHEFRHVTEICANGHLRAIGAKREANRIDGVMRNREGIHINITDSKALPGLNRLDPAQALPEGFRQNTFQLGHRGFRHVQRRFPQTQHLWEAVAVVAVLVGDEDCVEMMNFQSDGRQAGKRLAFSEPGVHKDAGAFGFEQRQVARTTGRKNGDAQADGNYPRNLLRPETFQIMAEGDGSVNAQERSMFKFLGISKRGARGPA